MERTRLWRTGCEERKTPALLKTNAGSSLNTTLSSIWEILLALECRSERVQRQVRKAERVTAYPERNHRGGCPRGSSKTNQFQIGGLFFFNLDAQRLQELQVLIVDL